MNGDAYRELLALLERLDSANIAYRLANPRKEAVMVEASVPGQRWEIELVDYGDEFHWEVEIFVRAGAIRDESAIETLFATHGDADEGPPTTNTNIKDW